VDLLRKQIVILVLLIIVQDWCAAEQVLPLITRTMGLEDIQAMGEAWEDVVDFHPVAEQRLRAVEPAATLETVAEAPFIPITFWERQVRAAAAAVAAEQLVREMAILSVAVAAA
jgi:hypothetical protein